MAELMRSYRLFRNPMELAFSLSIISLLFSISSLLSFILSFNFLFPSFSHYAINKNCVFLLCNGLLMFLAKTSNHSRNSSEDYSRSEFLVMDGRASPLESQFTVLCSEKENAVRVENADLLMAAEEKDKQDAEEEEEEEEEDEANGMLSLEELNRKFDDFIRKMKEEIRIEEVQQPLLNAS